MDLVEEVGGGNGWGWETWSRVEGAGICREGTLGEGAEGIGMGNFGRMRGGCRKENVEDEEIRIGNSEREVGGLRWRMSGGKWGD